MNISGFDLNLLPIFEALMDERNVSRAAARVGLSQPAMSSALRRLQEAIGETLFVRTANGMRPTRKAEQVARPIRAALTQARLAFLGQSVFEPTSSQRLFKIATNDYLEWRLEAAIGRRIWESGKGMSVQVRRMDALFALPETELRSGALDLAIGFFPDLRAPEESTVSEMLFQEDNVVVGRRRNSRFAKRLTARSFAEMDQAAVIYRQELWGVVDQAMAALGLKRQLRLATPHFLTAIKAVAESDLIACVPEGLARAFERPLNLRIRRSPILFPTFVTRMVWASHSHEDAAHVWLREQIREVVRQEKIRRR